MHAKFHCCVTTPSQSAYELFSPPPYIESVVVRLIEAYFFIRMLYVCTQ